MTSASGIDTSPSRGRAQCQNVLTRRALSEVTLPGSRRARSLVRLCDIGLSTGGTVPRPGANACPSTSWPAAATGFVALLVYAHVASRHEQVRAPPARAVSKAMVQRPGSAAYDMNHEAFRLVVGYVIEKYDKWGDRVNLEVPQLKVALHRVRPNDYICVRVEEVQPSAGAISRRSNAITRMHSVFRSCLHLLEPRPPDDARKCMIRLQGTERPWSREPWPAQTPRDVGEGFVIECDDPLDPSSPEEGRRLVAGTLLRLAHMLLEHYVPEQVDPLWRARDPRVKVLASDRCLLELRRAPAEGSTPAQVVATQPPEVKGKTLNELEQLGVLLNSTVLFGGAETSPRKWESHVRLQLNTRDISPLVLDHASREEASNAL